MALSTNENGKAGDEALNPPRCAGPEQKVPAFLSGSHTSI